MIKMELGRHRDMEVSEHSTDTRFLVELRSLVFGHPQEAARGVQHYMCVDADTILTAMGEGTKAIEREIELHGTEEDKECLDYILHSEAGTSSHVFPNGNLCCDCSADGQLLESRRIPNGDGAGMRLADFVAHPHSREAALREPHVVALRLYTTAAYRSINSPLRDLNRFQRHEAHMLPVTVSFIADGVRKLRAIGASQKEDVNAMCGLYRGMKDVTVPDEFLENGGTELAPMSTTTDLAVAMSYSASTTCVLMRVHTTSFMERGADLSYLSAFPAESEILFPPLTYLQPIGPAETITVGNATCTVINVSPHL